MKDKNHMSISIDAKNSIWQNSTWFHDTNIQQTRSKRKLPQIMIANMINPQKSSYSMVKNWAFPLRSGTRQGCPLSPLLFNTVLGVLAKVVRQEKKIKGIQTGKEKVKILLFRDDIILFVGNPKDSTHNKSCYTNKQIQQICRIKNINTEINCVSLQSKK